MDWFLPGTSHPCPLRLQIPVGARARAGTSRRPWMFARVVLEEPWHAGMCPPVLTQVSMCCHPGVPLLYPGGAVRLESAGDAADVPSERGLWVALGEDMGDTWPGQHSLWGALVYSAGIGVNFPTDWGKHRYPGWCPGGWLSPTRQRDLRTCLS